MLLALSDVIYVLIGWFKFLLLKFLYEYGPRLNVIPVVKNFSFSVDEEGHKVVPTAIISVLTNLTIALKQIM